MKKSPGRWIAPISVGGEIIDAERLFAKTGLAIGQPEMPEDQWVGPTIVKFHEARGEIGPAVVVVVLDFHMRGFQRQRNKAGCLRHILVEGCAIAESAVEIEAIRDRFPPGTFEVLADQDVEPAIAIHIAKADAADHVVAASIFPGENLPRSSGFREASLSVVQEENIPCG